MKAVPPLKLSLLRDREDDAGVETAPSPDLQATCSPRTAAASSAVLHAAHGAQLLSPRTASESGVRSARDRCSSNGAGSATALPAVPLQTDSARRLSGCEQAMLARQAAPEEKDLEPSELLERIALWGEAGAPTPRSSSCTGMPTTPRLALEPPPTLVAAVGTQVAIVRAQLQAAHQSKSQPQVHVAFPLAPSSPLSHASSPGTAYMRPRSSLSLSGTPAMGRAARTSGTEVADPLAPMPPPPQSKEPPQPNTAELRSQVAQAVATPVRRCYLKQLMDCYTPRQPEAPPQGPCSLPAYLQGGDEAGTAPGGGARGQAWHEMPAEVTNFLRFHNGGKKAFHDQMATEAKQALARRYALSTDSIDTSTAEWLGLASPRGRGSAPGSTGPGASAGVRSDQSNNASDAPGAMIMSQDQSAVSSPRHSACNTPLRHRASCDNSALSPRTSQGGQSVISQALYSQACYSHPGTTTSAGGGVPTAPHSARTARRASCDAAPSPRASPPTSGLLSKLSQMSPASPLQPDSHSGAGGAASAAAPASPRQPKAPGPTALKPSLSAGAASPTAPASPRQPKAPSYMNLKPSSSAGAASPMARRSALQTSAPSSPRSSLARPSLTSAPAPRAPGGAAAGLTTSGAAQTNAGDCGVLPVGPMSSKQTLTTSELEKRSADSLHLLQVALNPPDQKEEHMGADPTRKWRFNTKAGKAPDVQYMYVCKQSKHLYGT